MNIFLVGRDAAPSQCFEKYLDPALIARGHMVRVVVGNGKPMKATNEEIVDMVFSSDLVIVGMSSSKELADPEITACEAAIRKNVPFIFYGDTFGCHERAGKGRWFAPYAAQANGFFAINEQEAAAAQNVFHNAMCVATGNPTWESYATPELNRQMARELLGGFQHNEILVLAPGGKSPVVNIGTWMALIEALSRSEHPVFNEFAKREHPMKYRLLLACHPGDRTMAAIDPADLLLKKAPIEQGGADPLVALMAKANLGIYDDLVKFGGSGKVSVQMLDASIKTSRILPAADMVVDWGSSISIEAGFQGIPVINIATEVGKKRLRLASGLEEPEICKTGAAMLATFDVQDLSRKIVSLLFNEHRAREIMRKKQAEMFQSKEKGSAVKAMIQCIEELAKAS